MIINSFILSGLEADFIPVILDTGQSNSAGRAEADRLALMIYPDAPSYVYTYFKTNYTTTDNGTWQPILGGSNTTEPDVTSFRIFGASFFTGIKFREFLNRPVYVLMCGDGGTALKQNLSSPDWSPLSSAECFDTMFTNYLQVALGKLVVSNPGKQIVVFPSWHQGETDAFVANNPAFSEYPSNYAAFDIARQNNFATIQSLYPRVLFAPTAIRTLNYLQTSNETSINSYFTSFVAANRSRYFLVDTVGQKRNIDLTTAEKGGITATNTDDEHLSHLAMEYIAVQQFNYWKTIYNIGGNDSEITSNTNFNPATISTNYVRLQMNRANSVVGLNNVVTGITNSLTGVSFTAVNNVRFKVNKRKGAYFFPQFVTGSRIESNTPVGTTYFSNSFSFSCWIKQRDGQPTAAYYLMHDIQSTGSPNNSRAFVSIDTTGKITVAYAVGGTAVQGITNTAVWGDTQQIDETHVAATFTSGGLIRIYINGIIQTLDAVNNGNLASLNMSSYVNATNKLQFGARRTGVSSYDSFYFGMMREVTIQPVVYTASQILNDLMQN